MSFIKLTLFCFLISLISLGQDTLFLKDKHKLIVIVKEVSPSEIQYKKVELADGPMYITSKKDVEKIIYKNGYTEVFKTDVPSTTSGNDFVVYKNDNTNVNTEKLVYKDAKRRYNSLIGLIERHPDPTRKPALIKTANSLRGLKAGQDATRTVGIVFGGITIASGIVTGLIYSFDTYAGETLAVVPLAFGTAALIAATAAVTIHINLKKKRYAFVNLYNQ